MNVLVLTPDRVGSTLLQRLITIHMQSHDFGRPVINLHELTNGIVSYYNPRFEQQVLGRNKERWDYHQSLKEIVDLLDSADHYKTARLAHYHIVNRQDPMDQQLAFYRYINENFFIISARRNNLLEHALSWCIFSVSKRLNVYGHEEKFEVFSEIYRNSIHVDQTLLVRYLDAYVKYTKWVDDHFNVNSYFDYEKDLPGIEEYINNLNLFDNSKKQNFWQNMFGIGWQDWNMCHYLYSDLSTGGDNLAQLPWEPETKELLPTVVNEVNYAVKAADKEFLSEHAKQYWSAEEHIQQMVQDGILASSVPIKLQTLIEKCHLIKNFKECVDTFNQWAETTKFAQPVTTETLLTKGVEELATWHAPDVTHLLSTNQKLS
jgi:hypothetical protein